MFANGMYMDVLVYAWKSLEGTTRNQVSVLPQGRAWGSCWTGWNEANFSLYILLYIFHFIPCAFVTYLNII